MNCPSCHKENEADSSFCIFCGSPMIDLAPADAEPQQGDESEIMPNSAERQLLELKQIVIRLADRVAALEKARAPSAAEAPPRPPRAEAAAEAQPREGEERPDRPGAGQPDVASAGAGVSDSGPAAPPYDPPEIGVSVDWERVLGVNWFAIVGAVALAVGVGFFLKLAFENDWIGITGRIVLGLVTGLAMLAIGEYTQRRFPRWAQAVTGGGISILYLSIYAAFAFYSLIGLTPALVFLGLVVATSGLLAIRYESLVIAMLGLAGAFITPVLLGRDLEPEERYILLAYILVVDAGILGVSTFRNWRWFTLVGLVASYALFGAWMEDVPTGELVVVQAGLTAMFLIFTGATTLFHIVWRIAPRPQDLMLMTLNAMAFFGETYGLLWEDYEQWFGLIALSLSLFYGMVGYGAIRRSGAPVHVALFSLAAALVFLTVAMPLQLTGSWITVAWAAEAAVLVWVGFTLSNWQMRAFALGVFAIAVFRLLFIDTTLDARTFTLLLNSRFPTFAVSIAAMYVAAYLYWRERSRLKDWEEYVGLALAGLANLLTLWALSAEVIDYFERVRIEATPQGLDAFAVAQYRSAENAELFALTALWAIYAGVLLAITLAKRSPLLRWAGLGLLSLAALKLLLVDTFEFRPDPRTHMLVLNFYFLTFAVALGVSLFAAYLYRRERDALSLQERHVFLGIVVAANVLSVWVFSAEIVQLFDSLEVRQRADFASAKHLSLTVMWAFYAVGVIAVGMWRESSAVRLAGVLLMAVPVVKLFGFDVFLLERGFRAAAFVTLGVLLLATGLVYQRYSTNVKGFLFGQAS